MWFSGVIFLSQWLLDDKHNLLFMVFKYLTGWLSTLHVVFLSSIKYLLNAHIHNSPLTVHSQTAFISNRLNGRENAVGKKHPKRKRVATWQVFCIQRCLDRSGILFLRMLLKIMILCLFFAFFSGLIFVDYQFNDWESESTDPSSLTARRPE